MYRLSEDNIYMGLLCPFLKDESLERQKIATNNAKL